MVARRRRLRLFVTGGSGFLGRHVTAAPVATPFEIVAPRSSMLDLRHRDSVMEAFGDWRPDAVVHTAYRRGDRPSIVDASTNVAEAATAVGARLVHVSSDALFAGRDEPYREIDPPDPIHDYGRDKADAEASVAEIDPEAVIVRTSLIYGTTAPSVHEIAVREAIAGRTATTFFTDEYRCPVLVDDVAAALVDLVGMPDVAGVLHLAGPTALSRAELAVMAARRHGWDASALRFSTNAASGLTRPARVLLDSSLAASLGLGVRGPAQWRRV